MPTDDLEALLRKKNLGEVKVTPQGFIDDAGTHYIGKHISALEHSEGRLGDFKWIELPDGSVFQIEKKVPAYGTIPGELPFDQKLADEPSRGAREIFGAEERGPKIQEKDFSPEGTRKAREQAAREASEEAKRASELQPKQGPLRWASATQRDWQAEAAQDPSEYIMEAERPGSFDEPRLSDQFRGSKGGITRHEDDLFQTLLKGDRNDLIDLRERNPYPFGGSGDFRDGSYRAGLKRLPEAELRTELINEYLGRAADNFDIPPGGPEGRSTWSDMPGGLDYRRGDPVRSAANLAEDIARPGTKMGDIGWEAGEWAVESRSFERMVNAAKKAGVHLGDNILKVAKGFGKAGLKAIPLVGLAAEFADIPTAEAGTMGSEFESAPEARERQKRDIESEEFLAEQPGYEPEGTPPAWADPEWEKQRRFGEEPEEEADYSPEGTRKSRDAAAKKAMEK